MSAIYYYSIADFSFFFKSYLQRNQIFFRNGGRCCKKRENLDDKRAGKRYFERFCWMLLNMKCSLTENRNYVILFLKNRQEGTKLSPEEEKVQRLEQRIAQLEQALQEKNAPASSQPPVPSTILQQETPPTIPPPAPEIPPMQTTQPTRLLFNRMPRGHHRHKPCNLFRHRSEWIPSRSSGKLSWGFLLRFLSLQRFSLDMHFCPVSCRWSGCSSLEQAFPLLGFTGFLRRNIPTFS